MVKKDPKRIINTKKKMAMYTLFESM
jgi:hypothetical protein